MGDFLIRISAITRLSNHMVHKALIYKSKIAISSSANVKVLPWAKRIIVSLNLLFKEMCFLWWKWVTLTSIWNLSWLLLESWISCHKRWRSYIGISFFLLFKLYSRQNVIRILVCLLLHWNLPFDFSTFRSITWYRMWSRRQRARW